MNTTNSDHILHTFLDSYSPTFVNFRFVENWYLACEMRHNVFKAGFRITKKFMILFCNELDQRNFLKKKIERKGKKRGEREKIEMKGKIIQMCHTFNTFSPKS